MIQEFKFPDIGEGIHEGKLLKWHMKVGDMIQAGDTIAEVETDKVNAELPSPYTGKVTALLAEEGGEIYVGQVLIKVDTGADEESQNQKVERVAEENAGVVGALEASSEVIPASSEGRKQETVVTEKRKVLATPVARKMAHDLGVDLTTIRGTGPGGRVMKADIRAAAERPQTITTVDSQPEKKVDLKMVTGSNHGDLIERVPLTMLRKTIAKKMVQSKYTAPHATAMDEIDVTELVKFRENAKDHFGPEENIHLTFMPFIMKAIVLALKKNPKINSSLDEEAEEIVLKKYYHLGIAVDTEEGLMVPVIRNVDQKSIVALAQDLEDLSQRARARKLIIDELKDSTFSITNYGAVGSIFGVPVINYPEVAIMGIGKISKKPVVLEDKLVLRHMLPVSMSFDHRVVDGGDAGRFMNDVKKYLSDPYRLLLL
ncbi:pyruvate dehydrogenase E2 component (dihydrolipoamide acetyltransferase) [Anaerosolibacter carboniphilus]|uniref:Dihydrolipoamide acetyltransferase component of pyruvate dehydrogenase complex n=1 Tax=Anaerosolibacter carboniphilus TaxID=1417629 RepID=A0A841KZZ2_9FIRM|nr:dihydrolipoamide acetyltransferase family protein [Anaerosolibacter carboniphilus]MBB6218937.1 pyruvate dehydrogenase E2 component (dihydrolipoamide acetyltransferase) [Anaerosolibacter carboniphilus]